MVNYKGRDITDFFKPYSQSSANPDAKKVAPIARENLALSPSTHHSSIRPQPLDPKSRATISQSGTEHTGKPATTTLPHPPPCDAKSAQDAGLEPLTQTSAGRSSQRVTVDGEDRVLDSDADSEVSLQDLDEIINQRKTSASPKTPADSASEVTGRSTRRPDLKRKNPEILLSNRDSPRFSIQELAAQARSYAASKAASERIMARLEQPGQDSRLEPLPENHSIEQIMQKHGDEDGDLDRIKRAITRTDVLHPETSYSFFDAPYEPPQTSNFPVNQDSPLSSVLSETVSREQCIANGFVEDFVTKHRLPAEVVVWILDASWLEPREHLRQAYIAILKHCTDQLSDELSVDYLRDLFQRVGAACVAVRPDQPVEPRSMTCRFPCNHQRCSRLLDMLRAISPALSSDALVYTISITCRLLMDASIVCNGHILTQIEQLLTALLANLLHSDDTPSLPPTPSSPLHSLLMNLYNASTSAPLRLLLLRYLPVLSQPWLSIRRTLALSWFLSQPPTTMGEPTFSFLAITSHLSSASLSLSSSTNFADFSSLIQILDFALDSCNRRSSPQPSVVWNELPNDNQFKSSKLDHDFDQSIDALATRLRSMFLSIVDSGASDLRRTEAKEALEALRARLLYSVRARAPDKKRLFWDEGEELGMAMMRKGMEGWLER